MRAFFFLTPPKQCGIKRAIGIFCAKGDLYLYAKGGWKAGPSGRAQEEERSGDLQRHQKRCHERLDEKWVGEPWNLFMITDKEART